MTITNLYQFATKALTGWDGYEFHYHGTRYEVTMHGNHHTEVTQTIKRPHGTGHTQRVVTGDRRAIILHFFKNALRAQQEA